MNAYDIITKSKIDEIEDIVYAMTTEELDNLLDKLFCYWTDIRKTLDEQMVVNNELYSNFYIYMAREAEAKSKYLYVKAIRMMCNKNK